MRGYMLADAEKYDEALVALNEAVRLDPKHPDAYDERRGGSALEWQIPTRDRRP